MPETTTTEQLREQVRGTLCRSRPDRHIGAGHGIVLRRQLRRRRLMLRPDCPGGRRHLWQRTLCSDGPGQPPGVSRGSQPGLRQPHRGG